MPDSIIPSGLSLSEAADIAGVRPETVARWAKHGCHGVRLKAHRVGHRYIIAEDDLREFIRTLSGHATDAE